LRSGALIVAGAAAALLSACGGGARQDASEPKGNFPVKIVTAAFPASQRLSQHTNLIITVQNAGTKAIPDVALTLFDAKDGPTAQAFGQNIEGNGLASRSRPVWIIDRPPGPCQYSCQQGGEGGAATAYTDTWALGRLGAGKTATFEFGVTAVKAGHFQIRYQVAAGLNGKAKAIDASGQEPTGIFNVTVAQTPAQAYVNNAGQVVTSQ